MMPGKLNARPPVNQIVAGLSMLLVLLVAAALPAAEGGRTPARRRPARDPPPEPIDLGAPAVDRPSRCLASRCVWAVRTRGLEAQRHNGGIDAKRQRPH